MRVTFAHYRATLDAREAAVDRDRGRPGGLVHADPFADEVARLAAYRGVTELGALTLACEVCDWRRFPTAGDVHGVLRAGPEGVLQRGAHPTRGHITHAGNLHLRTQLVESAWAYKSRPAVGDHVAQRHAGPATRASSPAPGSAQLRLCGKFRRLDARKTNRKVVVTAIARELAGFLWAEMTAEHTIGYDKTT